MQLHRLLMRMFYISEQNKISIFKFRSLKQLRHLNSLDIFGVVDERGLQKLHSLLGSTISLNQQRLSYVARPTYGLRRTSVWGLRTRP
jgi:F-box and leucine-rich repeat protein 1 (S-phase kinase-associated protein 2)